MLLGRFILCCDILDDDDDDIDGDDNDNSKTRTTEIKMTTTYVTTTKTTMTKTTTSYAFLVEIINLTGISGIRHFIYDALQVIAYT